MLVISPIVRTCLRIVSWAIYAVTLLAAFGGHINPDHLTLPSILVLVLPYLALLTFIISLAWFATRHLITGALGIAAILIGWSGIGASFPLSLPDKAPEGAKTFRILTFNSLHLDDIERPDAPGNRAANFLINCGADIICLQELVNWDDPKEIHNFSEGLRDSLFAVYPYRAGLPAEGHGDLKVLSKYPVTLVPGVADLTEYVSNRFAYFRVDIDGTRIGLVNMHLTSYSLTEKERNVITDIHSAKTAKNSAREFKSEIFSKLQNSFQGRADNVDNLIDKTADIRGPLIVCGDFNDVPASWSYRKMRSAGFKDAYAETSFGPAITYNQHMFLFHLDQIFYRGNLQPLWVKKERIKTSDHYPLMAEFAILPQ